MIGDKVREDWKQLKENARGYDWVTSKLEEHEKKQVALAEALDLFKLPDAFRVALFEGAVQVDYYVGSEELPVTIDGAPVTMQDVEDMLIANIATAIEGWEAQKEVQDERESGESGE